MASKTQGIEPKDLGRSLGLLVHDVARLMRRAFDRRVKHLGLTRSQWFVLAHLYRSDGQTQRHLADELDMERAPLSKLLDRLESGGWLERRADRVYVSQLVDMSISGVRAARRSQTNHRRLSLGLQSWTTAWLTGYQAPAIFDMQGARFYFCPSYVWLPFGGIRRGSASA